MTIEFINPIDNGRSLEQISKIAVCKNVLKLFASESDRINIEMRYGRKVPEICGLRIVTMSGDNLICPMSWGKAERFVEQMKLEDFVAMPDDYEWFATISIKCFFELVEKVQAGRMGAKTGGNALDHLSSVEQEVLDDPFYH